MPEQTSADTRAQDGKPYEDILTAFHEIPQVVLLGDPGAGKSTTLRRLATKLAQRAQHDANIPLPLLCALNAWRGDEPLIEFLRQNTPELSELEANLIGGRIILLLDGLNEVPTGKRHSKAQQLRQLLSQMPPNTPVVVCCRRDDYTADINLQLDTLTLEPLSPPRVRAVLTHWLAQSEEHTKAGAADQLFWQLAGDERLAEVFDIWRDCGLDEAFFWRANDIREGEAAYAKTTVAQDQIWRDCVRDPRSLVRLAGNPFMLTMLYQVWVLDEGELPSNRGELFRVFIYRLLARENLLTRTPTGTPIPTDAGQALLDGLTALAGKLQGEHTTDAREEGAATTIPREVAVQALGSKASMKYAEDTTLIEGGADVHFRHQLFQEYFAALAMRQRLEATPPADASLFWPEARWWERTGWEEAAILLAGLYAEDCYPVVNWLRDAQPEVATACVLRSGALIGDRPALMKSLTRAWQPRLEGANREPNIRARAAVGRALGALDLDGRTGVGLTPADVPQIEWVAIPGGRFVYQDGKDTTRQVAPFSIAKHLVTNAQFQAFIADGGYADDRWWQDLDVPTGHRQPEPPRWALPNHPREMVSWFEAMAFCAWLSKRTGLDVRLPGEWEYERAARGENGRTYPWGDAWQNGYANTRESRIERTTAVGLLPEGASPEGVMDLAGNLWEWCLNEYHHPDKTQAQGSVSRVLRGGCWLDFQGRARANLRIYSDPVYRDGLIGCRLVCSSPIL